MTGPATVVVGSTFTATPLVGALQQQLATEGRPSLVECVMYAHLPQYLLAPRNFFADRIVSATVVVIRPEDWLRTADPGLTRDEARRRLRERAAETLAQIRGAAEQGSVHLLCCPAGGTVARRLALTAACQTAGNLLCAQAAASTRAHVIDASVLDGLKWELDLGADRLGQVPFTQECFDALGHCLGRRLNGERSERVPTPGDGGNGLASYLRRLRLHVRLTPIAAADTEAFERLLITVGAFNLTGSPTSAAELRQRLESTAAREGWAIRVADRTGDYGICGLAITQVAGDVLRVESWLLSCPVLGKQVEHAVASALAHLGATRGCARLAFEFAATGKNQAAGRFVSELAPAEATDADGRRVHALDLAQAAARIELAAHAPDGFTWDVEGAPAIDGRSDGSVACAGPGRISQ